MSLRKYKYIVFIPWLLTGCILLGPKPDTDAVLRENQKLKLSVSFIDKRGARNIHDSSFEKYILNEMQSRYPEVQIETAYDDLRSGPNYVVNIQVRDIGVTEKPNDPRWVTLAVLLPLPCIRTLQVSWDVYDSKGEHLYFSRDRSYNEFLFLPLIPFTAYQSIAHSVDKRIAEENIAIFGEFLEKIGMRKTALR